MSEEIPESATHVHSNHGPVKEVDVEDPLIAEDEMWVELLDHSGDSYLAGDKLRVGTNQLEKVKTGGSGSSGWKKDDRPAKNAWAPGDYVGQCSECGDRYQGDKRSRMCADCAYEIEEEETSGPTGETYEIETLEDMVKIPDDRIDAFLKDLKNFLTLGTRVANLFEALGQNVTGPEALSMMEWGGTLNWTDDGKHDQTVRFVGPDGEELAEVVVGPDGVEPAEQENEKAQE